MDRLDDLYAQRAAALAGMGLKLPAPFLRAVAAYQAAMALTAPPVPDRAVDAAATAAALTAWKRAAATGGTPHIDIGPLAVARQQEQQARDERLVVAAIRDAAAAGLITAAAEHQGAIVAAIRSRYRQVVARLIEHAASLPATIDSRSALEAGEPQRTDFLAVEELVAEIGRLQAALIDVADDPAPGEAIFTTIAQGLGYVKSEAVSSTMLVDGTSSRFGVPSTLPFFIEAAKVIPLDDWWLPTPRQIDERAAAIIEAQRMAKVRAGAAR